MQWIAHPTYEQGDESTFQLVVAGRRTDAGEIAVMMVEAGGTENSWELYEAGAPKVTEEVIAEGLDVAKEWIGKAIDLQQELVAAVDPRQGPDRREAVRDSRVDYQDDVFEAVAGEAKPNTAEAMAIADKTERNNRLDEILEGAARWRSPAPRRAPARSPAARARSRRRSARCRSRSCGERIVNEGVRIDGRGVTDLRPLSAEVGILNTVHGSGLFQRGETQVLSVLTLGMSRMEQIVDTLGLDDRKRYMHHYNFPPFSTGETGRVGSPKRREIGHGALAERALAAGRAEQGGVALHAARRLRRARVERLHLDGVGLWLDALDDGRGGAAQGSGRRHRDGPRLPRRQVHDPHRHPRCGGRVRRHGLQGRRHRPSS